MEVSERQSWRTFSISVCLSSSPSQYDGNSISFCPSAGPTWSYFPWQFIFRFFYRSKTKRARKGERGGRIAVAASAEGSRGVSVLPPPSSSTSDRSALISSAQLQKSVSFICSVWFFPQAGDSLLSIGRSARSVDRRGRSIDPAPFLSYTVLTLRVQYSTYYTTVLYLAISRIHHHPTTTSLIHPSIRQSL